MERTSNGSLRPFYNAGRANTIIMLGRLASCGTCVDHSSCKFCTFIRRASCGDSFCWLYVISHRCRRHAGSRHVFYRISSGRIIVVCCHCAFTISRVVVVGRCLYSGGYLCIGSQAYISTNYKPAKKLAG